MEPGAGRGEGILHALWRPRFVLLNFPCMVSFLSTFTDLRLNFFTSGLIEKFAILRCNCTDPAVSERVFTHIFYQKAPLKLTVD